MSGPTKIEWADVVDLTEESVMTAQEVAGSAPTVKAGEMAPASAGAGDGWIRFSLDAMGVVPAALCLSVRGQRRYDGDVLRPVVRFVPVEMMHLLPKGQTSANGLLSDQAMLVNVAPNVGEMVARHLDEHVAIRGDCPAALPVRVSRAWMNDSHGHRIAPNNHIGKKAAGRLLDGVEHNAYPGEGRS